MPEIRANQLEIAYEVVGAGPPLVLLHGASTSARETFAAQIPRLAESFQLYLPDARGHGATRWDVAGGFRAEWLVDDLEAFVDALGLRTFHLIGYSMGAMTALGFATRAPERLRTLVVVGITPAREPRASVARRLMDPERILRDDPGWAAEMAGSIDPVQGPGAWQRLLPAIAADLATQPLLTPAELRAITAPTLVACGDRDPLTPVGQAWELSRQVRDGRLFVAPDSGHDVLARRPTLSNEALRDFYRSTESVARARAQAGARLGAAAQPEVLP
jgi:pimeloyl-ACP methyl ester carboxylesterase